MSDCNVRRWARFGHERLYAETSRGTVLGFFDVKTEEYHCDDVGNLPLLKTVIAQYRGTDTPPAPSSSPTADPPPLSEHEVVIDVDESRAEPEAAWEDLSRTQAGASARQRALAEREAQGRLRHGLARLIGAKTDERAWRIGADGEEAVAEQLAKLDSQWRVLHAVPVGNRGSDIDHVVIGPAGVFTVNAKNHPNSSVWVGGDTFMVNGHRVPYIRNSRHEGHRASKLLSQRTGFPVRAVGVVAVVGAHKGITIKKQPEDGQVVIVRRKRIRRYLHSLPARLGARDIEAIYEVARQSTTWHP